VIDGVTRRQGLICSIKGKVKKKNFSRGWNFSTFAAQLIEQDLFWSPAPGARLPDLWVRQLGVPLLAVFIACWQRSLSVPKPAKLNVGQVATMVLSGTRGP
jgi:hypothetical protein